MSKKLSVYSLVQYLKSKNDNDPNLLNISITGELSNVKLYPSNHLYFDLKDDKAKISGVMFASFAKKLIKVPNVGDSVIVKGSIKVYQQNTTFQLIATDIILDGYGKLFLEFEKNKELLEKDGYFDVNRKRDITKFPARIAVISGHNSAALKDVLKTLNSRYKLVQVIVFPCLVQGVLAPSKIIETINLVNKYDFDTIILARGGGSFEDLSAFNDINLAKTIFNSKIPIITGIGHESDFTIADFVSDYRALTPTAAAIKATPEKKELQTNILKYQQILNNYFDYTVNNNLQLIDNKLNTIENSFKLLISTKKMSLSKINNLLEQNNIRYKIQINYQKIHEYHLRISSLYPFYLEKIRYLLFKKHSRIVDLYSIYNKNKKIKLNEMIITLNLLDPNCITNKGYAIVYKGKNVIKNSSDISKNDVVKVESSNYSFFATIDEVIYNEK